MAEFIIALVAVIVIIVVFLPLVLLLFRYAYWMSDKIDNWFEKHGKGRGRDG